MWNTPRNIYDESINIKYKYSYQISMKFLNNSFSSSITF